ncbi:hypothetical protein OCU04_003208 [Sclerotinia nivalis]|uniref:Uncharacterized protein n=1 Tax=Sclerotinia nivalis TaxID=352851 RepID=A0A9X0DQV9_9HELO|nr:hypothetical protein OCU04_003208 [Sclerotinia nivalis]
MDEETIMVDTILSSFPRVILGTPTQEEVAPFLYEESFNNPPFILSSPTPFQSFNSQAQHNILSFDDPFKSSTISSTLQFNNKRRRQFSYSEFSSTKPKEAIQKARDLFILAISMEKDIEEQSKILNLIEIFREYLEKGKLIRASNIITSQISHFENATKRIEKQTNYLSNLPNHSTTPSTNPSTINKESYTSVTKTVGEWKIITKGNSTKQKPTEQKEDTFSKRLILINPFLHQSISFILLYTRNKINEAFKKAGINGPVISTITTIRSNNIILTINSPFNTQFLIEKKKIWNQIIRSERIQIDKL